MTLLDAPTYNARRARILRIVGITVPIVLVALAISVYFLWDLPEEHRLNRFFAAVESGGLETAFARCTNDHEWQQHPDRYKNYDFDRFSKDWGPASDYGTIRHHDIIMAKTV